MDNDPIEAFWRSYLDTLPSDSPTRNEQYVAERFGDSPQMADKLGALVVSETKTATSSAFWEWEAEVSNAYLSRRNAEITFTHSILIRMVSI
jgi:uncharacterized protein YhfF